MRILLVEDEHKIAQLLKKTLQCEGFVIDCSFDGEEGSYAARTHEYDLFILDNQLPKRTGLEVCCDIRNAGKTTPILILSIETEPHTKAQFLNAGADDYVNKPFSFEELIARIHALLRRPPALTEDTLIIDDLTLERRKYVVTRGARHIQLTNKEFALLEYLMRNKNQVLSRGMIFEHVWDMNMNPFSSTIDTHIRTLRKKLNQGGQKNLILTVPGRGYKMSDM